jgi:predicted chitinase
MINTIKSESFNTNSISTEDIKPTQQNSEVSNQNEINTKPSIGERSYNNKMDMDFNANYYKTILTQTSLTSFSQQPNNKSQPKTANQTNKSVESGATKEVANNPSPANKYTPLTMQQIDKMIPSFSRRTDAKQVLDALNYTMERCECNTPERKAMFLAQTRVESGDFRIYSETGDFNYFLTGVSSKKELEINANGNVTVDNKETKNIHRGYLKKDLGNKDIPDAIKFTGKGFLQVTGRVNFTNFNNWLGKNIKQDPKLKTGLENQVKQEIKDNPQSFIKAADEKIKTIDDSIVRLNETYVVKTDGKPQYLPGINTLERKIAGYQESIDKLKKIPDPTEGQKKTIQTLTTNQTELKTELAQTKAQQEKLKQDCIALQEFKQSVENGDFSFNLDKADFTQEPYTFLIGASPTLAGSTTEYYWKTNNLNKYADSQDVMGATRAINGGAKALEDRKANFEQGLKELK